VAGTDAHSTVETIWRMEAPKLIAGLTRLVRDIGTAEDLAHDALVAALEQWPSEGIPQNPGAWLMQTGKHRAIDYLRRTQRAGEKRAALTYETKGAAEPDYDVALDDDVGDDLLRLIFTACHPVLSTEARTALTLRLLGGLTTAEIARAFLVSEATVAQRIVRAKKTLAKEQPPFEVPRGADRAARLASVLDVIYLIFNEGYAATAGRDLTRPDLCEEALRLARVLAGRMPDEPEVHGLAALLELQASRLRARVGAGGEAIPLPRQNRASWDRLLIQRGLAALARAEALGEPGAYTLQAAIAACHARALSVEETDWSRIAQLYMRLAGLTGSPVVEINQAVAIGMSGDLPAALERLDRLAAEPTLASYYLLPAARGELLDRAGRGEEAATEFARAAALTQNARERAVLEARAGNIIAALQRIRDSSTSK
jgi:RNA polymerase sigma factor (sigma-70 family)